MNTIKRICLVLIILGTIAVLYAQAYDIVFSGLVLCFVFELNIESDTSPKARKITYIIHLITGFIILLMLIMLK